MEAEGAKAPDGGAEEAADSAGDKRAALRASMKSLLQSKSKGKAGGAGEVDAAAKSRAKAGVAGEADADKQRSAPPRTAAAGASAAQAGQPENATAPRSSASRPCGPSAGRDGPEEDPWPEVRLSATSVGIEDGKRRAGELQRRGDFAATARMWAKLIYLARRSTPAMPAEEFAVLSRERCEVLSLLELWGDCEAACSDALRDAALEAPDKAHILVWRARASAEGRGDCDSAQADLEQALGHCQGAGETARCSVEGEAQDLRARIEELRRPPAPVPSLRRLAPGGHCGTAPAAEDSGAAAAEAAARSTHAAKMNQAFFSQLDAEYAADCAKDGWDEITSAIPRKDTVAEPTPQVGCIPADSDYFSVRLPEGSATRELRRDPAAPEAEDMGQKYLPRPKRNLDELRRVEAETRKAVEQELARQKEARNGGETAAAGGAFDPAARLKRINLDSMSDSDGGDDDDGEALAGLAAAVASAPGASEKRSEPIRTKSDVTRVESLSDGSDISGDEAQKLRYKNAVASARALKEFERLGREKDERLARWRERWG